MEFPPLTHIAGRGETGAKSRNSAKLLLCLNELCISPKGSDPWARGHGTPPVGVRGKAH
jgi:hypothetical protein